MVTLFLIPLSFALPYTSILLQKVGIDVAAADLASKYCMVFMPGLFLNSYADAIDIFMLGMGKTYIIMYLQLAVIPLHIFFVWFFVNYMQHGIIGAANAHNCTAVVSFLLQFIYCHNSPDIKEAWYWPSLKIFNGLYDYLCLAIPGTLMLFFENLSMQALVIMAGATGDVNALAA